MGQWYVFRISAKRHKYTVLPYIFELKTTLILCYINMHDFNVREGTRVQIRRDVMPPLFRDKCVYVFLSN